MNTTRLHCLLSRRTKARDALQALELEIAQRLREEAQGCGEGPSDQHINQLAIAIYTCERLDVQYLQLVSWTANELIERIRVRAVGSG